MKLSQELFDYFKERCEYWRQILGITDMQVAVDKMEIDDAEAVVFMDKEGGLMSIFIGDPIEKEIANKEMVDMMAFHEVFEGGYLGELADLAKYGYTRELVSEKSHRVVRMAENTIFKFLRGY